VTKKIKEISIFSMNKIARGGDNPSKNRSSFQKKGWVVPASSRTIERKFRSCTIAKKIGTVAKNTGLELA
jgi:hypothetical protein